ncbi:MAG: FAD:protein FMN transferase [Clostridia bacterium]|nr:FAD:protein FMN transferase [Clostridia bacterium]
MKRLLCAVLPLLLLLVGCQKGPTRYSRTTVDTFDTVVQLIAYDVDEQSFAQKADSLEAAWQEYDRLYDIYNEYEGLNNLCTVNRQAGIAPVKVDARILDLLAFGKEVYTLSGGKVNIAAGAVLKLWHDARTAGLASPATAVLPDSAALKEAAKHTDIEDMILDREAGTVYLKDAAMSLDVGAIAKGYATEQICRQAETLWESAAVSAGGNVRTIGVRGDGSPWQIAVENPDQTAEQPTVATVQLEGESLVTSGDYQRYYTVGGVPYHHIIDPVTLAPAAYVHETSVLCDDSGLADALSTALFLMPVEDGKKLVDSLDGVEALWVTMDHQITMTDGFESRLVGNGETR